MNPPAVDQYLSEQSKPLWVRVLPLAVIISALAAFLAFGLHDYVNLETLREHQEFLKSHVTENIILAVIIYMLVYAAATSVSVPGATVFTITGGFLFGSLYGLLYTLIAATAGATAIFLIARFALGDFMRARISGSAEKILAGFNENAFTYLIILRLVPLFPFFVVNIAPAFAVGIRIRDYVITTFIGIIPGTLVYTHTGATLESLLGKFGNGTPGFFDLLTIDVLLLMAGLIMLSLIPLIYKYVTRSKTQA
jgi:uncharacterized membrane protein YdjX (TVP38/TMEM64 family)